MDGKGVFSIYEEVEGTPFLFFSALGTNNGYK